MGLGKKIKQTDNNYWRSLEKKIFMMTLLNAYENASERAPERPDLEQFVQSKDEDKSEILIQSKAKFVDVKVTINTDAILTALQRRAAIDNLPRPISAVTMNEYYTDFYGLISDNSFIAFDNENTEFNEFLKTWKTSSENFRNELTTNRTIKIENVWTLSIEENIYNKNDIEELLHSDPYELKTLLTKELLNAKIRECRLLQDRINEVRGAHFINDVYKEILYKGTSIIRIKYQELYPSLTTEGIKNKSFWYRNLNRNNNAWIVILTIILALASVLSIIFDIAFN